MEQYNSFFLLYKIADEDKTKIIESFSLPVFFKKGEMIYSAEKYSNAIGFIIKGTAVATADNGSNIIMKAFKSGMSFGAAAVFGQSGSYVSNILAESDCEILFITEGELKGLFEKFPQTAINYISFLSDKIRFLNDKINVLSCGTTEDTVLRYLVSNSDSSGYAELPKNMTLFAKMLGIGRASLYRSLDLLTKNGLIIKENNKIKVKIYEKNS